MKKMLQRKAITEGIMYLFFLLCGMVSILFVVIITGFMIQKGTPAFLEVGVIDFLFGKVWKPTHSTDPQFGIFPIILSSLYGTAGAVCLGVPIGVLMAIFLSKIAPPSVATILRSAVTLLAGIPSVVYGLIGAILLVPNVMKIFDLPYGFNLFSAIIVLAVMILPSIVSVSETALKAVPREYEEASLALGGSHMETVFKVSVPAARSGITAGIVLGIGRALGEAMAVMMVAGNVANMPELFTSVAFLTTTVAKEMAYSSGLHRDALFSIALVLLFFILVTNTIVNIFFKKEGHKR
ncbi:MAG: phosphate ABC transporter permease subunit PstC [Eubacteriales bacterium]